MKLLTILFGVVIASVFVEPLASAAWRTSGRNVRGLDVVEHEVPGRVLADTGAAALVTRYLTRRNAAVDQLLPGGAGGTVFVTGIDDAAVTFGASATIALRADRNELLMGESVELHERAHLLGAAIPQAVAGLLGRIPRPVSYEYAATDPVEHFAEMAGQAWSVLVPPFEMSFSIGNPIDRLREFEQAVPGTAGFVVWYLRQPVMHEVGGRDTLLAEANTLIKPYQAEWEAIWNAIESRRVTSPASSREFVPWPRMAVAQLLEEQRDGLQVVADPWLGRYAAVTMWPALTVSRVAGW
jgi:hypothetical protein